MRAFKECGVMSALAFKKRGTCLAFQKAQCLCALLFKKYNARSCLKRM